MPFPQRIATIAIHCEMNDPKFEINDLINREAFFEGCDPSEKIKYFKYRKKMNEILYKE